MKKLHSCPQLKELIEENGFIPLFRNGIPGFSVEELTDSSGWWTGDMKKDPWTWRIILAADDGVAYGKLFGGKAGFISKELFPLFASYRRDGYDFDALYEDGKISGKCRAIMDLFAGSPSLASYDIKELAGFGRSGKTGFEGALTHLQMKTYLTVRKLEQKRSRAGVSYGWHAAIYSTAESLFGYDFVRSEYGTPQAEAEEKLIERILKINAGTSRADAEKIIRA